MLSRNDILHDRYHGKEPQIEPVPLTTQQRSAITRRQKTLDAKQRRLADVKAQTPETSIGVVTHGMISLSSLVIEPTFQRPLDAEWVLKEAQRFDWRIFGELVAVPLDDGTYSVVDGQHRMQMLNVLLFPPTTPVPCEIHHATTYEQRSWLFRTRNERRRAPTFGMLLRARKEEGDPEVLSFEEVILQEGFSLDYTARKNGPNPYELRSPKTLWAIHARGGRIVFRQILRVLKRAFGPDLDAYQNYSLAGTYSFLYRYSQHPNFTEAELIRVLTKAGSANRVWGVAAAQAPAYGKEKTTSWAIALHYLYNFKKMEGRRLPDFVLDRLGKGLKYWDKETGFNAS